MTVLVRNKNRPPQMGADQFNIPPAQIFIPRADKVRCDRKLDNPLELTIRKYSEKDLAEVLSAWESASEVAHPFLSQGFLDQERRNIPELYLPNADTWVAEHDGHVVGFIALIGNEVGAIFVSTQFHGKGVGRALMNKAREIHGELVVEVFRKNEIGRNFYSKYGFEFSSESIHEQSGNALLRLEYSPNVNVVKA